MPGSATLNTLCSSIFVQPLLYAYAAQSFRFSPAQNRICMCGIGGDVEASAMSLAMFSSIDCFACLACLACFACMVACGWRYPGCVSEEVGGVKWLQYDMMYTRPSGRARKATSVRSARLEPMAGALVLLSRGAPSSTAAGGVVFSLMVAVAVAVAAAGGCLCLRWRQRDQHNARSDGQRGQCRVFSTRTRRATRHKREESAHDIL
jgi:hypothetical protein